MFVRGKYCASSAWSPFLVFFLSLSPACERESEISVRTNDGTVHTPGENLDSKDSIPGELDSEDIDDLDDSTISEDQLSDELADEPDPLSKDIQDSPEETNQPNPETLEPIAIEKNLVAFKLQSDACIDPDINKLSSSETFMLCDGSIITGTLDLTNLSPMNILKDIQIGGTIGTYDPDFPEPKNLLQNDTTNSISGEIDPRDLRKGFSFANSSPLGWWDATDESTLLDIGCNGNNVESNGDFVFCWLDKSGNDNHMQKVPTFQAPTKNGNSLNFNVNESILMPATLRASGIFEIRETFLVISWENTDTDQYSRILTADSSDLLVRQFDTDHYFSESHDASFVAPFLSENGSPSTNIDQEDRFTGLNWETSILRLTTMRDLKTGWNVSTFTLGGDENDQGGGLDQGSNDFRIHEMITYSNHLTDKEAAIIEGYLACKHNIRNKLVQTGWDGFRFDTKSFDTHPFYSEIADDPENCPL